MATMTTDKCVDLKLDRNLIDPLFDGYKLSLDPLGTYQKDLDLAPDVSNLGESQYSLQHVKAFGIHNHLFLDPWDTNTVYFVNTQWKVCRVAVDADARMGTPMVVMEIPNSSYKKNVPERLNVSMHFPAPELCVLADGAGTLFLIDTGNRKTNTAWTVSHMETVVGEDKPFIVRGASLHSQDTQRHIEVLLLHVLEREAGAEGKEGEKQQPATPFVTVLEWLTFSSEDGKPWNLSQSRRLEGACPPDYASIDAKNQGLFLAGEKPFKFVYDSVNPIEEEEEKMELEPEAKEKNGDGEPAVPTPAYTWSQTDQDVTVQFTLPKGTDKTDIAFTLTTDTVNLGLKGGACLLKGELNASVDVEGSVWTMVDGNRLELHLSKQDSAFSWPLVVVGDTRGEMVLDPAQAERIHQQLAHLTSDKWNPDPDEDAKPPYNAQQLEECDDFPEESSQMVRYDGLTHKVTHKVNLGSHQWLFNSQSTPDSLPTLCLRHDVDGIIWKPDTENVRDGVAPWSHLATFNAFGYVQASKQQRKYTVCAPNHSFTAICDRTRHMYVYRQPSAISSPLRNRKTGRQVSAVAKQQVVAMESVDDIVGCQATNEYIFVMAGKTLYAVQVNAET